MNNLNSQFKSEQSRVDKTQGLLQVPLMNYLLFGVLTPIVGYLVLHYVH